MCYVEKGETILIGKQEFFVNDCRPKCGIVDKQTIIELEVGFTREVFKKKQVLADQRFAEKIQSRDQTGVSSSSGSRGSRDSRLHQLMLHGLRHDNLEEIEELLGAAGLMSLQNG